MKIAKVEAIPVSYPEPNDFNALRHLCLARITADDGQVGWGESITQFPEANFAAKAIIEGMAPNLIGKDPVQTETLWRQNKQQAWWYGYHGGIASYAVAAIDIALWDLKGKALGKSVLDLLGGPVHDRLPAIASCHAHYESIPEMAEETAEWVSTGLQGLKTGFGKRGKARLGYDHDRDVAYVKAMREVLGSKMLMIDNGIAIKWDVTDAVRRAKAMEEYDLAWIEEPLGAWDPEGYANLRAKTTTRIAYGEREWTLDQFERVLATGTVDVVGVDPGRAEGITGFKQIAQRCEFYRRQANAHAWSSAIVSAASLAISFNSPACKLFELKPLRNPMQHDLVTKPFGHVDGWVYPPTGPGLGIEVIDDVVDGFRSENVLSR
jgi:L-alanine-DL-glutamate epimerase-like enolase superfamily enzyme